jgi:hypothetical protein
VYLCTYALVPYALVPGPKPFLGPAIGGLDIDYFKAVFTMEDLENVLSGPYGFLVTATQLARFSNIDVKRMKVKKSFDANVKQPYLVVAKAPFHLFMRDVSPIVVFVCLHLMLQLLDEREPCERPLD